jgi:COP9 signalosome complex subunit 2
MSDESEYEYSDDDAGEGSEAEAEENEAEIEIENAYYEADDCKTSNPSKAAELFEKVVRLEEASSGEIKWRFKALEHLVVVYISLKNFEQMLKYHNQLLGYISKSAVTRNECTSAINNILEAISGQTANSDTQSKIYQITLDILKQSVNNERLWFNTYVRFGKACLASNDVSQLHRVITELHKSCQLADGSDDPTKGTYLLEVYALEIQYCTLTNDRARLKFIYPKTLNLNAAVADPRIMGLIREEGGKMYMREKRWNEAYEEFYESFRGYQEAGNPRAKDALKYVVREKIKYGER